MKFKDLKKLSEKEMEKKLKNLKLELIKSRTDNSKFGSKIGEIKKMIARIKMINSQNGGLNKK